MHARSLAMAYDGGRAAVVALRGHFAIPAWRSLVGHRKTCTQRLRQSVRVPIRQLGRGGHLHGCHGRPSMSQWQHQHACAAALRRGSRHDRATLCAARCWTLCV
jgi:hypothetical protein